MKSELSIKNFKNLLEIYNVLWYNNSCIVLYKQRCLRRSRQNNEIGVLDVNKKRFKVGVRYAWCKSCGICVSLCPTKIIKQDEDGKAIVENSAGCIGCRMCELHCPDFCIEVREMYAIALPNSGKRHFVDM